MLFDPLRRKSCMRQRSCSCDRAWPVIGKRAMLLKLKQLLAVPTSQSAEDDRDDSLRLAAAVLMVEAALMDEEFCDVERRKIAELLGRKFDLSDAEALGLVERAEARSQQSVEIYGFTREIKNRFTEIERGELMEMLWEIAYADGRLHMYEDSLVLKISDLLHVSRGRVMKLKHDAETGAN